MLAIGRAIARVPKAPGLLQQFTAAALTNTPTELPSRPIPKTAQEFNSLRRAYNDEVSLLRRKFLEEYREEQARIKASKDLEHGEKAAELALRKAERLRLREARKAKTAVEHEARRAEENAAAEARRAASQEARRQYLAQLREKQVAWLDKMDEASKSWIPEEKIDEVITVELFSKQHPWHLEEWYAHRERQRMRAEASRRGNSGISVPVGESDEEFQSDWEEDVQNPEWLQPYLHRETTGISLAELKAQKSSAEIAASMNTQFEAYLAKHGITAAQFTEADDEPLFESVQTLSAQAEAVDQARAEKIAAFMRRVDPAKLKQVLGSGSWDDAKVGIIDAADQNQDSTIDVNAAPKRFESPAQPFDGWSTDEESAAPIPAITKPRVSRFAAVREYTARKAAGTAPSGAAGAVPAAPTATAAASAGTAAAPAESRRKPAAQAQAAVEGAETPRQNQTPRTPRAQGSQGGVRKQADAEQASGDAAPKRGRPARASPNPPASGPAGSGPGAASAAAADKAVTGAEDKPRPQKDTKTPRAAGGAPRAPRKADKSEE